MEGPFGKGKGKGSAQPRPPPPPKSSMPQQIAPAPAPIKLKCFSPQGAAPMAQDRVLMTSVEHLSASERAMEILRREPAIEKTTEILACFDSELDRRPPFESCSASYAAHGTSLAAALSALRNTNGQLVPISRLEALGNLRATGATPEEYLAGSGNPLMSLVFAANLQLGGRAIATAERYAKEQSGIIAKLPGAKKIEARSEAAWIPVVLLGSLADPHGTGAALNETFQNPPENLTASIPKGNPLYGMTVAAMRDEFADQIIGERFNIHMVLVAHPIDPNKDPSLVDLVMELVQGVATEQGCDYSDIRVGLLRKANVAFKEVTAGKGGATTEDIQRYLYEAPSSELPEK